MAIPARLSRTLHDILGEEGADDLVNWMTQVDSSRSDLRDLMESWNTRTDGRFDIVESRFVKLEAQVDRRFGEVNQRFDGLTKDMHASIAQLEVRLEHRLTDLFKWSFVFWCGAIGIAVLTLILK